MVRKGRQYPGRRDGVITTAAPPRPLGDLAAAQEPPGLPACAGPRLVGASSMHQRTTGPQEDGLAPRGRADTVADRVVTGRRYKGSEQRRYLGD
jgi:hypothetical protein